MLAKKPSQENFSIKVANKILFWDEVALINLLEPTIGYDAYIFSNLSVKN